MRIGIDARLYGPRVGGGGLGRYVEQLVKHLEQLDQENEYVIFLRQENWKDYEPATPNFKKVLAPWRWYTLAEQIKMPRLIHEAKLDLIHYPHFNAPIFAKTPFVVTIHDLNLLEYPKAGITNLDPIRFWTKYLGYRFILKQALKKARQIITVSNATREAVLRRFSISPERVIAIPLGHEITNERAPGTGRDWPRDPASARSTHPPVGYFRRNPFAALSRGPSASTPVPQQPYLLPTTHYLLAVGNAYPHKNLNGLLAAFHEVLREKPELTLVLTGPEDRFRERIRARAVELGVADHVIFTGFVNDIELDELYRQAAAYVMPSFLEGFGFPGLEAQARDCPVLASDLPALHETFGEAALYFNPQDPFSISQTILKLLNNSGVRELLVQNGLQNAKLFNWERTAAKTLLVYKQASTNL